MLAEDENNTIGGECHFVYDDLYISEGYRVRCVRGYAIDDCDPETVHRPVTYFTFHVLPQNLFVEISITMLQR